MILYPRGWGWRLNRFRAQFMLQVTSLIFCYQHLREAPELALQGNLVAEWSCIAKRRVGAHRVGISKHLTGGSDDWAHKESICTDCVNFAALSFRSSAILCAGTEEWHLSLGDFSQVESGRRCKKYTPPSTLPASSQ